MGPDVDVCSQCRDIKEHSSNLQVYRKWLKKFNGAPRLGPTSVDNHLYVRM